MTFSGERPQKLCALLRKLGGMANKQTPAAFEALVVRQRAHGFVCGQNYGRRNFAPSEK
jgi:hypothetical protein